MANSSIIGTAKMKIIKELIKDKAIVKAIDSPDVVSPEKLINTHIFNYHQNPHTINKVITFITVQVHIPQSYMSTDTTFKKPTVEIWIISHEKHMAVDNIPKVTSNRNDYISQLIDEKLNGKYGFGIGELTLVSNVEGSYQQDYVFRKMIFETVDLNASRCIDEWGVQCSK